MDEKNVFYLLSGAGIILVAVLVLRKVSEANETTVVSSDYVVPPPPPEATINNGVNTMKVQEEMEDIHPLIQATSDFYYEQDGIYIEPRIIKAVTEIESNWDPFAQGGAGEIGLMQLMPSTAQWLGFDRSLAELYEPSSNIRYGTKYLVYWAKRGYNTEEMVSSYNMGHLERNADGTFQNQRYVDKFKTALANY